MRALIKDSATKGLTLKKTTPTRLEPQQVRIKVSRTGICGTDVHIYNWDNWARENVKLGTTIGHEFFGYVSEIGSGVREFNIGDPVTAEGHIYCGICKPCLNSKAHLCKQKKLLGINYHGAFSDNVVIPYRNIIKLDGINVDADILGIMDPLGNAVHVLETLNYPKEDILIFGAGSIGLIVAQLLKHLEAKRITIVDINSYRLGIARSMGIDYVIDASITSEKRILHDIAHSNGFSCALEMSGSLNVFQEIVELVDVGGSIAAFGLSKQSTIFDWNRLVVKGLRVYGVFGRRIFETWDASINHLKTGLDLTPIITHRFPAVEFDKAFLLLLSGNATKVTLDWDA